MEKDQAQAAVTSFVTIVARKAIRPQIAGVRKEIRAKETKRAIARARNMSQGWKMESQRKRVLSPRQRLT